MRAYNKSKKTKHSRKKYKTYKTPYAILSLSERYDEEYCKNFLDKPISGIYIPKKKKPFSKSELICEEIDSFSFHFKKLDIGNDKDNETYRGEYDLENDYSLSFVTGEIFFIGGKYNQYEVAIKRQSELCSGVSRPYTHKQVRALCKRLKGNKDKIKNFIKKIS